MCCHTRVWIAPGRNSTICQECSKSTVCGMELLNIFELIPNSRVVTTKILMAGRPNTSIWEDYSKCRCIFAYLLYLLGRVSHFGAVSSPYHHTFISQDCSKAWLRRTYTLDVSQLVPDSNAFATKTGITPRHNTSIYQDGSESSLCGIDFLDIFQFLLDLWTVTAKIPMAPGDHFLARTPQSKCAQGCNDLWLPWICSNGATLTNLPNRSPTPGDKKTKAKQRVHL